MVTQAEQRAQEIRAEKMKVYSIRGPNGTLHCLAHIQPLGSTIVTVHKEGTDYKQEHDFRDFKSARDFVTTRVAEAIEKGEV